MYGGTKAMIYFIEDSWPWWSHNQLQEEEYLKAFTDINSLKRYLNNKYLFKDF